MTVPEDFQDRLVAFLRDPVLPIVLIVVIALVLIWFARTSSTAIVKAVLDREVSEGTAQELSAVEVTKRVDTLELAGQQRRPGVHRRDRRCS